MANQPKFRIGEIVYNKVSTRGSYGPSFCNPHERMTIDKIERCDNSFQYTCGYNGYKFMEDQLMSRKEYKETI